MKFESEFGIGEIVDYTRTGRGEIVGSELFEVVGITFERDGRQTLACRYHDGRIAHFAPDEVEGDPMFDQVTGEYPPDAD